MVENVDVKKSETITFYIGRELKKRFQIKLIDDNTTMTEKLTEMINQYVG